VEVEKGQALNQVFVELERLGIKVVSMRTKANRLEELFIRMVEENAEETKKAVEGAA
jgi:ABC-2 type transport system ATP-binding protein